MNEEIWRSIKNFSKYQISNKGRIRSWKGKGYYIRKLIKHQDGYLRIQFRNDNLKLYSFRVHRLVLEAFISPCPDKYEANHKDGNKENNRVENLEWVTHQYNIQHAVKKGFFVPSWPMLIGEQKGNSKLKNDEVWLIKKLLWYDLSTRKIAKMFKVGKSAIHSISSKRTWSHIRFEPSDKDRKIYRRQNQL